MDYLAGLRLRPECTEASSRRPRHGSVDDGRGHVELRFDTAAQLRRRRVCGVRALLHAIALQPHGLGHVLAAGKCVIEQWVAELEERGFGVLAQADERELTVVGERQVHLRVRQFDDRTRFRVRDFIEFLDRLATVPGHHQRAVAVRPTTDEGPHGGQGSTTLERPACGASTTFAERTDPIVAAQGLSRRWSSGMGRSARRALRRASA